MFYEFFHQSTKYKIHVTECFNALLITYFNNGVSGTSIYISNTAGFSCRYIAKKMDISIGDAIAIMDFVYNRFPDYQVVDELDLQHWMHALYQDDNRPVA